MPNPLSERAQGRWRGILPALGVPETYLTGKHGPCPLCGGTDRWRFDNKDGRGTWFCSKCGAGDGVSLVMRKTGLMFREAAVRIDELIGTARHEQAQPRQTDGQKRAAMKELWLASRPVHRDDAAGRYLYRRCGLTEYPPCLRFVPRLRYHDDRPSFHPGMVALMVAPDGTPTILHRTYLTIDGHKAPVASPRRQMPGVIARGAAVRLAAHTEVLGIAEGIETALSATALFDVPCWAALNAALLATWIPPNEVGRVIVFGDNDPGFAGQAAAYSLARRIAGDQWTVEVRIPDQPGQDWNDVHSRAGRPPATRGGLI
jgi:putative DNA primase/helicase